MRQGEGKAAHCRMQLITLQLHAGSIETVQAPAWSGERMAADINSTGSLACRNQGCWKTPTVVMRLAGSGCSIPANRS